MGGSGLLFYFILYLHKVFSTRVFRLDAVSPRAFHHQVVFSQGSMSSSSSSSTHKMSLLDQKQWEANAGIRWNLTPLDRKAQKMLDRFGSHHEEIVSHRHEQLRSQQQERVQTKKEESRG